MSETVASAVDTDGDFFQQAVDHLPGLAANLDADTLLYFYARFKQATVGPCNIPKPGLLNPSARKKWYAWSDLHQMSAVQARAEYVGKLREVDPEWDPKVATKRGAVYVSRMCSFAPEVGDSVVDNDPELFRAIKDNDLLRVKDILRELPSEVHLKDNKDMTPLHWAADRGLYEMVKLLLSHSTDVDARDEDGQTPLHYACSCGHLEVSKLLIAAGADKHIEDHDGQRPVDYLDEQSLSTLS